MKCRRCGKLTSEDGSYCEYCGISLAAEKRPIFTDKKHKDFLNLLAWWNIDESKIEYQANNYHSLRYGSYRAISAILLLFSTAVTILFMVFGTMDEASYFDVAIFLILAAFIYSGHRWAMITAMLLWTLEKGIMGYEALAATTPKPSNVIWAILWWALYMHYFYRALRVERLRNKMLLEIASGKGEMGKGKAPCATVVEKTDNIGMD